MATFDKTWFQKNFPKAIGVVLSLVVLVVIIYIFNIQRILTDNPNFLYNIFMIIFFFVIVWMLLNRSLLVKKPDALKILEEACKKDGAFVERGIEYIKIDKTHVYWESGSYCYKYTFFLPGTHITAYAFISYSPNILVTDFDFKDWNTIDKRKKLGLEFSTEDIKKAVEEKKVQSSVLEGGET